MTEPGTQNERFIDVGGVRTRYIEAGSGPKTIVLMHGGGYEDDGLGHNAQAWEFNLPALGAEGFRVVAFDAPGYGGTAAPADEEGFGLPALVAHALGFVRALGGGRVHLVGYGASGMVALRSAFAGPGLLRSVGVVDSAAAAPAGDPMVNLTLTKPLEPRYGRAAQAWVLERISFTPHHVAAGRFLENAAAAAMSEVPVNVRRQLTAGGVFDRIVRPSFARARVNNWLRLREDGLPVPVILIGGANDPLCPIENARALFDLIAPKQPVAHLRLIGRSGSMPFREEPGAFNSILGGFIRALA